MKDEKNEQLAIQYLTDSSTYALRTPPLSPAETVVLVVG